ncbi:hypothetical protein WR25_24779 [Diploscapter pachys]|uniref:Potassium channel domain-containing protein n=1 Tax=Diploscapter pachys TaxID=2018661 RepID=A0A2A2KWU4_9BILA|nr:hypothetical protein WR25_24779 [Diploscapter pachys]
MEICPIRLRYELDYWRIPVHFLSSCCQLEENNNISAKMQRERAFAEPGLPSSDFDKVLWGPQRWKIYRFLENPRTSFGAKVFSILSGTFVLISLTGLILSSMPEFQDSNKEPIYTLHLLEMGCMIYFTFEYMVRFAVNPHKHRTASFWCYDAKQRRRTQYARNLSAHRYGDLVPVTAGGKFIAAVASVCGIITLAFPISMIIERFTESTGFGEDENHPPSTGKKIKKRYVGF